MIYIGSHISSAGGYLAMGEHEKKLGGNTFAYFTRNPRSGNKKDSDPEDRKALSNFLKENGFGTLVAHAPYTMNLCSAREEIRAFSERVLQEDLTELNELPGQYMNLHPGSHLGQGTELAVEQISGALNAVMHAGQPTVVLLETMAGKGTEVGRSFEELRSILDRVNIQDRIGICFDTCHVWDAGYDIASDLDGVLKQFDNVIGLERLLAVHLNDSKNDCGARKDRHEKLGLGKIGEEALKRVIKHPALQGKPFILETPNEDPGYQKEISWVREYMI